MPRAFGASLTWVLAAGLAAALGQNPAWAGTDPPDEETCRALETAGLYDRELRGDATHEFERVRRWLVAADPPDFEAAGALASELGLPPAIFALEVGGHTPREDFRAWLASLTAADFGQLVPSLLFASTAAEASGVLLALFDHCLARPGFHLWTESTADPAILRVHALFESGPGAGGPDLDRIVVEEGQGSDPLECTPALPHVKRLLLLSRRPQLEGEFAASCRRKDPGHSVEVRLENGDERIVRVHPPAPPRTHFLEPVAPRLACTLPRRPEQPSGLELRAECAAATGETARRGRSHPGWNGRAEARVRCPHEDLDGDATTSLQMRCRPQDDGTVELLLAGELTAHAGWNRRGCVSGEDRTHCRAVARIDGEATTPLWIDLTSGHCLRVTAHESSGTGTPANNGSRSFGPEHFARSYLRLLDPDGVEVGLEPGSEFPLDRAGTWTLAAGGGADRMPDGWRYTASRNSVSGTYLFQERLRLRIFEAPGETGCGTRETTRSSP
jgi:hypothetical protein